MKLRNTVLGAVMTACATVMAGMPALAHQTYLIADLPVLRPGTDNFLILRNGTYHVSGYSITRKMSRDISIVMGGARRTPPDHDVADVDSNPAYTSTFIKVVAEKQGTALAGLAAHPDYIALPAEVFANYLHHEGMTDALDAFKAVNKLTTIRERYTKHAKAVFQVGTGLTDDYKTPLGYKMELFIEQNPGAVKVDDEVSILALYEGKPLANQQIYVSHAAREAPEKAPIPDISVYSLRTDDSGRVKFKITVADKWYAQMIHMQRLTGDEDADYESNWSTITFAVK